MRTDSCFWRTSQFGRLQINFDNLSIWPALYKWSDKILNKKWDFFWQHRFEWGSEQCKYRFILGCNFRVIDQGEISSETEPQSLLLVFTMVSRRVENRISTHRDHTLRSNVRTLRFQVKNIDLILNIPKTNNQKLILWSIIAFFGIFKNFLIDHDTYLINFIHVLPKLNSTYSQNFDSSNAFKVFFVFSEEKSSSPRLRLFFTFRPFL